MDYKTFIKIIMEMDSGCPVLVACGVTLAKTSRSIKALLHAMELKVNMNILKSSLFMSVIVYIAVGRALLYFFFDNRSSPVTI